MKQFIIKILTFGIGLLLINICLFMIGQKYYIKDYNKVNLSYNTYILADSHGLPLNNYAEEYGVYNFSAGSDSYFDMHRKVNFLIRNTDLKRIIISVDDHVLSKYREKNNNLDRSVFYTDFTDYTSLPEYLRDKYFKNYIVLLNSKNRDVVRAYLKSILLLQTNKRYITNWSDLPPSEQNDMSTDRARAQFPDEQHSNSLYKTFENIIILCEKNSVEIIGIKFPLSNAYINTIKNYTYNADSILFIRNLKVYDFKHTFTNEDFRFSNPDHLNESGGKEFVKILAREVL